jgi:hypothetical protein
MQAETQRKLYLKEQEMIRLRAKLSRDMSENSYVEVSVQTLVDCKNVPFTVAAEKILEAKIANRLKPIMSIIQRVEKNKIDDVPFLKSTVIEIMNSAYFKKSEDISNNFSMINFEDILYNVFETRYISKKESRRKIQQFLLGLKEYARKDERMDDFKKFIGFDHPKKYPTEILELYIKTMKCTEESFTILLSDDAENLSLGIEKAYRDIIDVFKNASDLMKQEILVSIIYESNIYCDNKLQPILKEYQRIKKFILDKIRYKENDDFEFWKIDQMLPDIINEDLVEGTLHNYLYKDMMTFLKQKHSLRIPVRKFMSIGLKTAIRFYESAKNYYLKLFDSCDANSDGYIDYYEFTELIKKIDPDRPRWKIIAIFEMTAGVQDQTNVFAESVKINFDQFLQCSLSHSLMNALIDKSQPGFKKKSIMNNTSKNEETDERLSQSPKKSTDIEIEQKHEEDK